MHGHSRLTRYENEICRYAQIFCFLRICVATYELACMFLYRILFTFKFCNVASFIAFVIFCVTKYVIFDHLFLPNFLDHLSTNVVDRQVKFLNEQWGREFIPPVNQPSPIKKKYHAFLLRNLPYSGNMRQQHNLVIPLISNYPH